MQDLKLVVSRTSTPGRTLSRATLLLGSHAVIHPEMCFSRTMGGIKALNRYSTSAQTVLEAALFAQTVGIQPAELELHTSLNRICIETAAGHLPSRFPKRSERRLTQ